ncbi:MAG TPA: glycosyltransferase family 2 protein [Terriglobales bacterium]|nr:glycosyltransferase family 2 protein [Terriglobales bacterium]
MVSLIVATVNRLDELERLLTSLEKQIYRDFEVIVVDQNPDNRLVAVLAAHDRLEIKHVRCARGLSRARNAGLRLARGDLIAIPDDDCWYPPDLLESVVRWFEIHPEFGLLGVATRTEENRPSGPNSPRKGRRCTKDTVWGCGVSPALFLRRSVTDAVGSFDEEIGVGAASRYQSGEETDYILRALELGFRMWFEPSLTVHHPAFDSLERLKKTTYSFALGTGRILRVHKYSLFQVGAHLLRSCGGAVVSVLRGNLGKARVYMLRALGQLVGYLAAGHLLRSSHQYRSTPCRS